MKKEAYLPVEVLVGPRLDQHTAPGPEHQGLVVLVLLLAWFRGPAGAAGLQVLQGGAICTQAQALRTELVLDGLHIPASEGERRERMYECVCVRERE